VTTAWCPGDPLPEGELWTTAMVAQYAKRSTRTVQRSGCPKVAPGLYDPATVRAFFREGLALAGLVR
jgi:hypothetical protein